MMLVANTSNAAGMTVPAAVSLNTAITGRALVLQSANKHARAICMSSHSILPYGSAAAFLLAAGCAVDCQPYIRPPVSTLLACMQDSTTASWSNRLWAQSGACAGSLL